MPGTVRVTRMMRMVGGNHLGDAVRPAPWRLAVLALVTSLYSPTGLQPSDHIDLRYDGADEWARVFDNPARDDWQKPDEVIRALVLPPNAVIADIGSGTGYFAVRLARAVPQGRVLGVDMEPDMVRYLNKRAERERLPNLVSYRGDADDPRLPTPVDIAILVGVYHHIANREQYFRRVRAALKHGGRVAIIDAFRIPAEQVKQELARAGFELTQEHSFLPDQYFLVFRPAAPK